MPKPRFFARDQVTPSHEGINGCISPAANLGRAWLEEVRMLATARRLPEMWGHSDGICGRFTKLLYLNQS